MHVKAGVKLDEDIFLQGVLTQIAPFMPRALKKYKKAKFEGGLRESTPVGKQRPPTPAAQQGGQWVFKQQRRMLVAMNKFEPLPADLDAGTPKQGQLWQEDSGTGIHSADGPDWMVLNFTTAINIYAQTVDTTAMERIDASWIRRGGEGTVGWPNVERRCARDAAFFYTRFSSAFAQCL
jgi:hypothetical protein